MRREWRLPTWPTSARREHAAGDVNLGEKFGEAAVASGLKDMMWPWRASTGKVKRGETFSARLEAAFCGHRCVRLGESKIVYV
jgi:hypothetical protein